MTKRNRILAVSVAGACALGAAAAVRASIPDASGVIHGCYQANASHGLPTGTLRVIDPSKLGGRCAEWEAPLNWSQRGVSGPTGARGPAGGRGPTGPAGASGGWFNANSADLPSNGNDVTEASVALPTGSFMLFGQAQVFLPSSAAAHCFLQTSGGNSTLTGAGDSVALDDTAMPVNGTIVVAAGPTNVNLTCFSIGAATPATARGALSAAQVTSLH